MNYEDANCMMIWRYQDAPAELQALSQHGGDEDFIAYVPHNGFDMLEWEWFGHDQDVGYDVDEPVYQWDNRAGSPFGCCSIDRHILPDGKRVYIGAHA